jgi:hypothetical protein
VGKPENQKLLRRSGLRYLNNIKTDLGEIVWDIMDWTDLAHGKGSWRALVNTAMNLWVL